MGRKVYVSSDMSEDPKIIDVAEEDPQAALLWPWFLTYFDDWGRAIFNAKSIKARVFPMISSATVEAINKAVDLYIKNKLLVLYEVDGKQYIAIPKNTWFKWQTHIRRVKRDSDYSRYPAIPGEDYEYEHGRNEPRPYKYKNTSEDDAQLHEEEVECAQLREEARVCDPTPTPSLSTLPPLHLSPSIEETYIPDLQSGARCKKEEASINTSENPSEESLSVEDAFEKSYRNYPRKEGKAKGKQLYTSYLKGRGVKSNGTIKFTHLQMTLAIKAYAAEVEGRDPDKIKQFDTFMGAAVIDYVDKTKDQYEEFMQREYGEDWRKHKFVYKENKK